MSEASTWHPGHHPRTVQNPPWEGHSYPLRANHSHGFNSPTGLGAVASNQQAVHSYYVRNGPSGKAQVLISTKASTAALGLVTPHGHQLQPDPLSLQARTGDTGGICKRYSQSFPSENYAGSRTKTETSPEVLVSITYRGPSPGPPSPPGCPYATQ